MTTSLATLLTISVTVIAAILVIFLLSLIPLGIQVLRIAREVGKLIDAVRAQIAPISRDVGLISRDVKDILQSIHRQVLRVEDGIETVHDLAIRVRDLEAEVQTRIEGPLFALAGTLESARRGVERIARMFGR